MAARSRCECGRVKSKHASDCRKCSDARRAKAQAEAQATVATGCCPQCGAGLRRNLALTGWWQCEQFGAEGFRKDSSKPACSFQTFTA